MKPCETSEWLAYCQRWTGGHQISKKTDQPIAAFYSPTLESTTGSWGSGLWPGFTRSDARFVPRNWGTIWGLPSVNLTLLWKITILNRYIIIRSHLYKGDRLIGTDYCNQMKQLDVKQSRRASFNAEIQRGIPAVVSINLLVAFKICSTLRIFLTVVKITQGLLTDWAMIKVALVSSIVAIVASLCIHVRKKPLLCMDWWQPQSYSPSSLNSRGRDWNRNICSTRFTYVNVRGANETGETSRLVFCCCSSLWSKIN